MTRALRVAVFALAACAAAAASARSDRPNLRATQVVVGPNVLVTEDIDAPHVESFIAVDPRNEKHLLGDITTIARTNGGDYDKTWVSFDGGSSWMDGVLPGVPQLGQSGDPQVGFGTSGTAYAASLVGGDARLKFYRSTDGGLTWQRPLDFGILDHEQLKVDWSEGPHRGRIYLTGDYSDAKLHTTGMQVSRSDDDGKTFVKPVVIMYSKNTVGSPGTELEFAL